jgi:hypothetical protein
VLASVAGSASGVPEAVFTWAELMDSMPNATQSPAWPRTAGLWACLSTPCCAPPGPLWRLYQKVSRSCALTLQNLHTPAFSRLRGSGRELLARDERASSPAVPRSLVLRAGGMLRALLVAPAAPGIVARAGLCCERY